MDYNFFLEHISNTGRIFIQFKRNGLSYSESWPCFMNNDFSSNSTSSPDGREQELSSFQRDAQKTTKPFKSSD